MVASAAGPRASPSSLVAALWKGPQCVLSCAWRSAWAGADTSASQSFHCGVLDGILAVWVTVLGMCLKDLAIENAVCQCPDFFWTHTLLTGTDGTRCPPRDFCTRVASSMCEVLRMPRDKVGSALIGQVVGAPIDDVVRRCADNIMPPLVGDH
eukprot:7151375-Pyramimonas_sp.AAC.1